MRLILSVLLAIELTFLYHMCDLRFKYEEDRTKTAVAIESDRYLEGQTNTSSDFISVQCHELHCTDNNNSSRFTNRKQKIRSVKKHSAIVHCETEP